MRVFNSFAMMAVAMLALVEPAYAQDSSVVLGADGLAALGIAIAAFGGAMGQSKAIAAALEAIGRNPGAAGQMFLPWLRALVLIESLVIYAFVIALKLVGLI